MAERTLWKLRYGGEIFESYDADILKDLQLGVVNFRLTIDGYRS